MTWCLFRGVGLANAHCCPPTRPLISAKNLISHLISSFFTGLLKTLYTTTRYYYNKDVQKWWWNPIGRRKRGHYNCPKYFEEQQKLFPTLSTYSLRFYLFFKKNDASLFAYTPKCQFVMKLPSQKVTLFIQPFLHIEFLAIFISFCNELLRMWLAIFEIWC